jgi:peptidyl-prolyl cis-trans isomerase D
LKQIKSGGNFAELAKKNSEDPISAAKGGELSDWVTHGQTVPEFDKVAFSLKKGDTSDLVKTQYGYHIIQVLDKQEAHLQAFDDVKGQLVTEWRRQRLNDQLQRLIDQAEAQLKKNPPEKVAADLNLQLAKADNVAPGDPLPEVGVNAEFEQAAFSLKQGEVTPPVSIAGNKVAMAQATALMPAHAAKFEDVEARIRETLQMEKAIRLMQEKATELYQKAASMGGDLTKAAQALKLEVKTSPEFDRQGAVEGLGPASMVADAFTKPIGTLVGPVAVADSRVIAKLVDRKAPDLATLATQRNAIRDELRMRKARERNALFEEGLRQALTKDGKIKIHQETLTRLEQSFRG